MENTDTKNKIEQLNIEIAQFKDINNELNKEHIEIVKK
jgi:hypothetical protein